MNKCLTLPKYGIENVFKRDWTTLPNKLTFWDGTQDPNKLVSELASKLSIFNPREESEKVGGLGRNHDSWKTYDGKWINSRDGSSIETHGPYTVEILMEWLSS